MSVRGKFIVFEGIDGSGKSSQSRCLARRIDECVKQNGLRCFTEEEPDSREILGGLIRSALHGCYKVPKDVLAYLYAANRIEHITRMLPEIQAGNYIVCDRYYFSNMAYNRTPDLDMLKLYELNMPYAAKLKPDLVIYIKITPEEAERRRKATRSDEELFDKLEEQRKIAHNYEEVFEFLKDEIKLITVDGALSKEALATQIWDIASKELEL